MYKLQNKSTFKGFEFYSNFDCVALKYQTILLKNQIVWDIVCKILQITNVWNLLAIQKTRLEELELRYIECDSDFIILRKKVNQRPELIERTTWFQ